MWGVGGWAGVCVCMGGRGAGRYFTNVWRTNIKMHSTESRFVIGSENAHFAGVYVVFLAGGGEGVKEIPASLSINSITAWQSTCI